MADGIFYDLTIKHRKVDVASALDYYNYLTVSIIPILYDE